MVIPDSVGTFLLSLYIICLSVLFIFGLNGIYLLLLSRKNKYSRIFHHPFTVESNLPTLTIQLPVYNEKYVVIRLLNSITNLIYPKEKLQIQVLDDSTDETKNYVQIEVEKYRKSGFTISHIYRENRVGFKAGALREGLEKATGEFIAIFDADFLPEPDFLLKMLPYFEDEKTGMVQSRWQHLNENDSILTQVQAMGLNGHFLIEQDVRNLSGFFINFNGTGGIFRKSCILDSGNWQDDTLTEDLDLSYRAQLKGWKFVFRPDITCSGELPSDISSWKSQQFRWTKGAIETCLKILPEVWKSDIKLQIKIQSTFHLTVNFVYPFILLAGLLNVPLVIMKNQGNEWTTIFNRMGFFTLTFVSSILIYWFVQNRSEKSISSKIRLFPLYLAFSIGLSINNTKALILGLLKHRSEFVRTPKFHILDSEGKPPANSYIKNKLTVQMFVELIFAVYCFSGAVLSVYFLEFSAAPFILLYGIGYLMMGLLSVLQIAKKNHREII